MHKKTALITGSSKGIGKAIATKFAQNGYSVIINCAHDKKALQKTKSEIEIYPVSCHEFFGDMGDMKAVKELFHQIQEWYGNLDVLVNNAGISYIGLLTDMTSEDWSRVISTNLSSVFNCCRLAVPGMIQKKRGKIINISSVWGNTGASCEVAYSTSKGGVNSFTKALAKELAPSHIQVNAVACGAIDTEMNHFLNESELIQLIEEIPANRLGYTGEVAELVYQLANTNEYLTGQVINLDGGWI